MAELTSADPFLRVCPHKRIQVLWYTNPVTKGGQGEADGRVCTGSELQFLSWDYYMCVYEGL